MDIGTTSNCDVGHRENEISREADSDTHLLPRGEKWQQRTATCTTRTTPARP
jgi:hypothetical protein